MGAGALREPLTCFRWVWPLSLWVTGRAALLVLAASSKKVANAYVIDCISIIYSNLAHAPVSSGTCFQTGLTL